MFCGECRLDRILFVHPNREDFMICCWQKGTEVLPVWIGYRAVLFTYFFVTFVYTTAASACDIPEGERAKLLIYMSYWMYFFVTALCGYGLLLVVLEYKKYEYPPKWTWCPIRFYWFLYTFTLPNVIMVTGLFWIAIYDKELFPMNAVNVIQNITNSFFMFIDYFLVTFPYRFLHSYMTYIFSIVYFLFSLIYQKSGGTGVNQIPIYRWLDWEISPWRAISIASYCILGAMVAHAFFSLCYHLKMALRKKYVLQGVSSYYR